MADADLHVEESVLQVEQRPLTDVAESNVSKEANDSVPPQKTDEDHNLVPSAGSQLHCQGQIISDPGQSLDDIHYMDEKIRPLEQQLQFLLSKADEFQAHLMYSHGNPQSEGLARVVPAFLRSCQPYFIYLESTARSANSQQCPLPCYIRTRLLQFSQQLCSRLEQLVLMYAAFNVLSLEEGDPLSVSHFFIGQCQRSGIKLSIFRYCRPAPFLATAHTGLFKCMRWNVDRQRERAQETEGGKEERVDGGNEEGDETEYYFLCYEEVPKCQDEAGVASMSESEAEAAGEAARKWSIGQWVGTYPDPKTEDISDWVLCWIPLAQYKPLVHLGWDEPSACDATESLMGALLSQEAGVTTTITI